ncbi:MAG: hypothetical protein WC291_02655 [Thermodesulfovibrionales bacterium]|jgi:kynureninase
MDRTLTLTLLVLSLLLALTLALAPRAQAQETLAEAWSWLGVTQPQKAQDLAQDLDQAWEGALIGAWEEARAQARQARVQCEEALATLTWAQQRAQVSMDMDEVKDLEALARMLRVQVKAQAQEWALYEESLARLAKDIGKARATQGRAIIWPW